MYYQYPYNLFNQEYLSQAYFRQIQIQKNIEQRKKIADAVKAISDYCTAARDIEPEYQPEAFQACLAEIIRQMELDKQKRTL